MKIRVRKTLIAAAVVLAAGGSLIAAAPANAATPPIQFSYIQYDSPGKDTRTNASLNAEYIRVINNGARVNLIGFKLFDAQGHTFTFPSVVLQKGGKAYIHTGKGTNNANILYWGSGNYVWNNDKDTATLRTATRIYDTCKWTKPGSGHTSC